MIRPKKPIGEFQMKRKIGLIIGALMLIGLGVILGKLIIRPNAVVLFQSAPAGRARTIPAAYLSDATEIPSLQTFNDAFVKIAEMVTPSVVTITTEKVI